MDKIKLFGTVLLLSALITNAFAQQNNPGSLFARDSTEGVYVRDSAVAQEKMALAFRLEHLKEWNKAADVYQELLQQYSDRVTPSDDRDQRIYQYTSVAIAVQQKLARWPQEGLDAYRARFETEAAGLLEQAGLDRSQLHKIVSQFFITDAAKQAAIALIDADMEDGDFAAAAWTGDRLLTLHPNLTAERPMLLYRTALAYQLAGNASLAKERADELKKDFATATGTVAGKSVTLADSLAEQLPRAHPPESARNDSWPTAFGSLDRARVPAVAGFGGAKLFGIDLTRENLRSIPNPAARDQAKTEIRRAREAGMMNGVMPVVDRGELFFQDNARIYAVSLDSGLPLAGWATTYDGDRAGRYAITAWSTPRNMQYTLTVTDDAVLGVMGQVDVPSMLAGFNIAQRDTRLVCLDRRTGKEKWVVRPGQLPTDQLKQLELNGTPLVVNDSVFITGHSSNGVQFQDCYLLCFDLSGHFRFASYVCSANSGAAIWDGDFANAGQDVPQLAYSSGRVFVLSNLGALAAVDAYDGKIVWLNLYPRPSNNNEMVRQFGFRGGWGRMPSQPDNDRPWTPSPVIVTDGKVFALPNDGQFVLAYDAGTGAEVKRIKLAHLSNAETLLAVIDDRMILAGGGADGADETTRVVCINWRNYEMANFAAGSAQMLLWRTTLLTGLRGRGFVTTDAVYVPTQKRLLKINLKNGRTEAQYPDGERGWDESESSGNVLVTQSHLIVAGPDRVNVYTDLSVAQSKLDKEVASAPDDPEVRLRYAEVMFVAGKYDLAVAKLDEATKVIGGLEKTTDAPARERIYACAMVFAEKLARDKNEANIAMAAGLYDRAAKAASSAQQQVNYRISRAKLLEGKDDAAELKLLQEILTEPTWRIVPVAQGDSAGPAQAATVAEREIDELIERKPQAYEPVAAQAQEAFNAAQTSADPGKLLAVAQIYPNAKKIAPQAMLKAADVYESVGNPRQAVQILRQLYFKYPAVPYRAAVIESLARNYLATPNHIDVAIARLAQGAKLPNNPKLTRPLALPDGHVIQDVSFTEALSALRKYHEQATMRSLPDFALPAPGQNPAPKPFVRPTEPLAKNVMAIVAPLREFTRNDRVVTFSAGGGVSVFAVGTAEPIANSRSFAEIPTNCAWIGDTLLVWSINKILLLKPDGSSPLWETELRTIPVVEVATRDDDGRSNTDNEPAPDNPVIVNNGQVIILQGGQRIVRRGGAIFRLQMRPREVAVAPAGVEQIWKVAVVSDRAILATSGGRIIALDLADGKAIWQMRPSDRPVDRLLASDDFVVGSVNDGSQIRVVALDTFSGQSIMHKEYPADGNGLVNLALAGDGKLVCMLLDRIECKDLFEPGDRPTFSRQVKRNDQNGAFATSANPDQLVISEGRIIAVSEEGRFLRVYSLENGRPLHGGGGGSGGAEEVDNAVGLQTTRPDQASDQVLLSAVGSRVYAIGSKSVVGYNLEQLTDAWHDPVFGDDVLRQGIIGKDYLLIVGESAPTNRPRMRTQFPTSLALRAYSRAVLDTGRESGRQDYNERLSSPAGIQSWQGVDGGLYYLTGDQKLYFLKGARQ